MDIRLALRTQYHAGFAMLKQAIDRCPDDLWIAGDHPRSFWRIAYHALYYTDLYLHDSLEAFTPWRLHRDRNSELWAKPWKPGTGPVPYTKSELLEYCAQINQSVGSAIDKMDLDAPACGFPYYDKPKPLPKLQHQLVNLRHLQQHIGQLSELLEAAHVDTDWIGTRAKAY